MRCREEVLRAIAPRGDALGEYDIATTRVVGGAWRGRDLIADDEPQSLRRRIETALDHGVEPARAFATRHNPALVAENLEMTAHSRLRQLEHPAQLPDHELTAVEQQQDPAARRIGEGADAVED